MKQILNKLGSFVIFCLVVILSFSCDSKNLKPYSRVSSVESEIIGSWRSESDQNNVIVFSNDGHVKIYIDAILQSDDRYSISSSCGKESVINGQLFMKTIFSEDGSENCDYINGINENNSGILSLMNDRGQTRIYRKI